MPDRFLLIREQSIVGGGAAARVVDALEDTYIILLLLILLLYIYIQKGRDIGSLRVVQGGRTRLSKS